MNIAIFTEGGQDSGFGHITRCLSLYQAFTAADHFVQLFIDGDDSITSLLDNTPFTRGNWMRTLPQSISILDDFHLAIIDSYRAPLELYRLISENTPSALYLDDTKRLPYPPGFVLNWSLCAPSLDYPPRDGVIYLLGPSYISLRKPFLETANPTINPQVKKIFITFGGDDGRNLTPKILAFLGFHYPTLEKHAIIGPAFSNLTEIEEKTDRNTYLYHSPNAERMKELMSNSDLAICSGGQTLYELARVGTPAITISVANNQLANVSAWEKTHFIENAGSWTDENLMPQLTGAFELLLDYQRRCEASSIGRKIVPADGSVRILEMIQKSCLRRARPFL